MTVEQRDALRLAQQAPLERLVVGVSGASGVTYAVRLLEVLRNTPVETHLVVSRAGALTVREELDRSRKDLDDLADHVHANRDVGAAIASGSFPTLGMVVVPCSARTLGEIAAGSGDNLIARAADVTLKERRRLVLVLRETPLHLGHLRAAATVTEMGGVVAPPVPAFYTRPSTLTDVVDHSVGRILDLFGVDVPVATRWTGRGSTEPVTATLVSS